MRGSDVKMLRFDIGLSQAEFARRYKINIHTLRQWERLDSALDSSTQAYMHCIQQEPVVISELLAR